VRSEQMPECPQCRSQRVWKDGLRETARGSVQRWTCRDCGYRFSETVNNAAVNAHFQPNGDTPLYFSDGSEHYERLQKLHTLILKSGADKPVFCRVGASDNEAKNLVEVETRTQEKAAGATTTLPKDAEAIKGRIVEYSFWLLKQGYAKPTIHGRTKLLKRLVKIGADLHDPESVKEAIAKQEWSIGRKANAVDAYTTFLQMQGAKWIPPTYKKMRKIPFIPTETETDQLIAGCNKRMATFLQLLKETAIRCGEACRLCWTEIDLVNGSIRVTPEKGSNARNLKISNKLISMLNELPKSSTLVFDATQDAMRKSFQLQRRRIAAKLKNPRLLQISFHTFRHWKATMEYHRTKDILHVMQMLGHRCIQNTLIYTQLVTFQDEDFIAKVATSEKEVCQLVEAGFEYVCDYNANKIFRKRK